MRAAPIVSPMRPEDQRADHYRVAMRDGTRLATDVYLPPAALAPFPVVLIRLPYDKSGRYTFIPQIGEYFAAHGFACVAQDVRGKYRSEGDRDPFVREADDGWDTVEWIVAQPWSDGTVGTWGDSYYGFTQWALASRRHPAHRAMVPRVTGHHFGDMRPGEGLPTLTLLDWLVDAWSVPELVLLNGAARSATPALDRVHPDLPHGRSLLEAFVASSRAPRDWVDSVFPSGSPAARLTIPALHVGGWFDNLHFWQLDDWESAARDAPAAAHQFLRMGSNDHEDYGWREPGVPLGEDFGADDDALARHLPALLDEPLSFFDHYLRGGVGVWPGPRVSYEHVRVGHRVAAEWPPARVESRSWLLGPGVLDAGAVDPGASVSWLHDPEDPVPFPIVSEWDQNREGLPDEQDLHRRGDVVCFDSPAFIDAIDLVGRVTFEARIAAPTAGTHVIARLCDVAPDGSARLVLGNAADVAADGTTPFRLRLGDTAYRVPAGHRLRLAISTSLEGQYAVHPGTDDDPWTATSRRSARQELRLGKAVLNVVIDNG